jgi:hypothetical protein
MGIPSGQGVDPASDTTAPNGEQGTPEQNQEADTQPPKTETPPAQEGSGHGVENKPSESAEELREKREEGKLQQTQTELRNVQEANQQFVKWASSTPERFRDALVSMRGMSEEEADKLVNQYKAEGMWKDTPNPQEPQQPTGQENLQQPDINKLVDERVQTTLQKERTNLYLRAGEDKFLEAIPEMDPANIKPEEINQVKELAGKVENIALALIKNDPSLDYGDALIRAYKIETGKTEEEIQKAREEGARAGYNEALNDNASTTQPSNSQPIKPSTVKLSPEDEIAAKRAEMSPEEWVKYGNMDVAYMDA